MGSRPDFGNLVQQFDLDGEFVHAEEIPSGHINDTYAVSVSDRGGRLRRYLMQRINHRVFPHPARLMQNVAAVTRHLRQKIERAGGDPRRETMNIIPTIEGKDYHLTSQGDWWRAFVLINGARTYETPRKLEHVYSAGRAFGDFQRHLVDFPACQLYETIPAFHDTRRRFAAFEVALAANPHGRSRASRDEIEFAYRRAEDAAVLVDLLERGDLPERVTHNDTKFNNVLIDDETGKGVCVIDLDTVMPGSSLFDFGDGIRSITNMAPEDERDLARVQFSLSRFEQFGRGFLDGTQDMLSLTELDLLPFSARLMTYEVGLRFLTDYLEGDVYFKTHRRHQNLDRCRVQFRLLQEMEMKTDEMTRIVQGHMSTLKDSPE
jgi:Ser/Thr protein kinase RdoA (MazF antagonist)